MTKHSKAKKMYQSFNKVTPLSKALALVLFILLPILAFFIGRMYEQKKVMDQELALASVTQANKQDLCNFSLKLPEGYTVQTPVNPFYGISYKDGDGQVCTVILGPQYKSTYEGFSGQNIQINAYPLAVPLQQLLPSELTAQEKLNNQFRFERESYGGVDQVLIHETDTQYYEILWRDQPNSLESVVENLAAQLP